MRETMEAFRKDMMEKMQSKQKLAGEKNLKEGDAFLAANAKKDGVKVLPSGLQYKVIKSGTGRTPKSTDTVKTHYHGTLIDGSVFDSSVERGEPATFAVNQVIAGWTEALQLMKEGDKWQLFIPARLAYGESARSAKIGPNSTLIFDIELLSIEKGE
jgi:FKBP-type peptidyl-prolyl cis-trans isomerase FklB